MRSVTVRLDDLRTTVLNLGFVGENEHTQIRIDSKKMYDQYPTASASLTVCPPDGDSYPAVIERDGDFVLWTITDSDLIHEGIGEIQLSFTVSEVVAKSYIGRFKVSRSIVPTGEIPEPIDDFLTRAGAALTAIPETVSESVSAAVPPAVDAALAEDEQYLSGLKNDAKSSADDAETAQHKAEQAQAAAEDARDAAQAAAGDFQGLTATVSGLASTASPTVDVTHSQGGLYNLAFGIPKGDKGDKGDTGDPAPAEQVTPAVDAYLAANFSNPSNPPLDRSLASSSSAAPADLVGDLKSQVDAVEDTLVFDNSPTSGSTKLVKSGGIYSAIASEASRATTAEGLKVNKPTSSPNGTSGQFLKTLGDGSTVWDEPLHDPIDEAVEDWLDDHPEATTTVQDGSLTIEKLTDATKLKVINAFVTPEMFGAYGDGDSENPHDDTEAINSAISYAITHGVEVRFNPKTYGVIPATSATYAHRNYRCAFFIQHAVVIDLNNATLKTLSHNVAYWSMFRVFNYNDRVGQIVIKNGKLIGDKVNGATGDYYDSTQLISIKDSKNVIVDNMTLVDSKGDGIGFGGSLYNDPYPDYPFEDFYMGIFIRNCTIDGSNRNGFSISKGRGIYIENCVVQNTTGLNPKLGVDLEPVYGKGNVFDVTFNNCIFKNNTNGSISGYSPDGITIENCNGDGGIYFRNCSEIKVLNSKFTSFTAHGADSVVDNCEFSSYVKAQIFSTTFSYTPSIIIANTKLERFNIGVPSSDGTHYEKVVFDNCTFKASETPIDGSLNGYYDLCDAFIVQNCTSETSVDEAVNAHLFKLRKISDEVIFRNNSIRISGKGGPYSFVGTFSNPIKSFEFVGNRIIFDDIEEGVTRNARSLFYNYTPDADSHVIIANNIVNIEGKALNTSGNSVGLFLSATSYVHIFARNNIFRKISSLDISETATIEENMNNLYGDIPTTWDGNMNILAGGTSGQFLTKNSNNSYDFAWVTVPAGNGVSF